MAHSYASKWDRLQRKFSRSQRRRMLLERLEDRRVLVAEWQNSTFPEDVNTDTFASPLDILFVVNELNRRNASGEGATLPPELGDPPRYVDTNGDSLVSPLDVLLIVNYLNAGADPYGALTELSRFDSFRRIRIDLSNQAGARTYRMQVDANFSNPDDSSLLPDLFSVYLFDPDAPSQTLLDRGVNGTSLFTLSSRGAEMATGLVRWDGNILELDLSSIENKASGHLYMELLNGDPLGSSRITIRPIENRVDADGMPGTLLPPRGELAESAPALNFAQLTRSDSIDVDVSNIRFNTSTNVFTADVELLNRGDAAGRDIAVVIDRMPPGASLLNASGTDPQGRPYLNLRNAVRPGGLGINGRSGRVELRIDNPSRLPLHLGAIVYAGEENRPPVVEPIANQSVMPGSQLALQVNATDPDGDRLTYSIRAVGPSAVLPTSRLDAGSGRLVFEPTPSQLGSYQVEISATDGTITTSRVFNLSVVADTLSTTRVSGRVLDVDLSPIAGMVVEIGGVQGLTQVDGRFTLDLGSGPLPSDTLKIRGETYADPSRPDVNYPFIAEKLPFMFGRGVYSGYNNVLQRPIYLPRLNVGSPVNPQVNTTVSAELRDGFAPVQVDIAAGSLLTQQGAPYSGNLSITEVPIDRTPAALPPNLQPDFLVTIQPGEMVFSTPAPLAFPNTAGWAPGAPMDLWSINPVTGEFEIVGQMQVTADGTMIETVSGGIRNSSWHFPAPPDPDPEPDDDGNEDNDCEECKATDGNFEVEAHSGAVLDDHGFVTYQSMGQSQGFALHYDSLRADPRPIIHLKYSNLVPRADQRLVARISISQGDTEFLLPGYDGAEYGGLRGGEHFWDLDVTGTGRVALQADLTEFATGVYSYELTSGPMRFDGESFAGTLATQTNELKIVNAISSPFGAGWGLHGLIEIVESPDGGVLWIDGGGSELFFPPPATAGAAYVNPVGDFSTLIKQANGTFVQTMPNQTVYRFNQDNQIASKTDRNGNTWSYRYVDGIIAEITDPTGLTTTFGTTGRRVTAITDPANRVTELEYDAAGNLVKIIDPDDTFKQWSYDGSHRIISETDKRGFTEQVFYDFAGRATKSLRADGSELLYSPVQVQILRSAQETTDPLNPPSVSDIQDIRSQFVDSNGNVKQRTLDKQGQFVRGTDSAGPLGTVTRNADNRVAKRNDSRGFTTDFTNDDRGNTTSIVEDILVGSGAPVINLPYDAGNQVAIRPSGNFSLSTLARTDDGSSGVVDVGFDLNFFGNNDRTVHVNNNGNITFDSSLSTYTPFSLLNSSRIIIAPFFADVDTRGVGEVSYGSGQLLGRNAFVVNWNNVGYYSARTNRTNTFQLVLVDRSDIEPGAFDFEMNYGTINWETGDVSGGSNGLGGSSARAGYSNGVDVFFELEGSDVDGGFLDDNLVTGLVNQSRTSSIPGRYRFQVRGGEVQRAMRQFEYDQQFNQLTRVVDELGRETLSTLDPITGNVLVNRRVVGALDNAGNGETDDLVTRFTYTTFGLLDTVTDPLGRIADYNYDARGRMLSVTYAVGTPDEATMRYEYDAAGNQTAMIDGNGNRTEYQYDALNRMVRTIEADPDGAGPLTSPTTTFSYDAIGNVRSSTDANGRVSTSVFDELNRLVQSIGPDPDGSGPLASPVTTYGYDPVGNLASVTDPNGNTTTYTYDGRNRRIQSVDPDGGVTRFGYDADNNLSRVTDPVGNVTQFRYDARDRLIEEVDPLGNSILYAYDAANNLIQKTDRNGRVTKYSYDDINRLVKEEWVGENEAILNTIDYSYDAAGNLLSVADAFSALAYTYDARNRVKTVDNAGTPDAPNVILTYGYDDNSNVLTVSDSIASIPGATTTYQYDSLDRLIVLGQSGNEVSDKRVNFTYNSLGQYAAIDRYRDLAGTQLVIGTDYRYDGQNRLTRIDHQNSGGNSVAFYDYAYDIASRITQITDVDGVTNYEYDDRDQLIRADHADAVFADESYAYDANGNRVESSLHGTGYETGPANRLLSDGTYNYEYDNEGNMIRRTEIATGHYREFRWDHRNRLVDVSDYVDGLRTQQVRNRFDTLGRRIEKSVDASSTVAIVHYVYDREDIYLGFSVGGQVLPTRYLHGPAVDQVLGEQSAASTQWLLSDHLGSVRDVSDDQGAILKHTVLNSFGLPANPLDIGTVYLFAGREYDAETNLYFSRSRFYSPELAQFLSEDTIGVGEAGPNARQYVGNNPLSAIDPFGQDAIYIHFDGYPISTPIGTYPLGHAGVVGIDPATGNTKYYEFGRYGDDRGKVRRCTIPNVVIGPDGRATAASLSNLYDYLSKNYGKGKTVSPDYRENTDYSKVDEYAKDFARNHEDYGPLTNNCKSFADDAASAGEENRTVEPPRTPRPQPANPRPGCKII